MTTRLLRIKMAVAGVLGNRCGCCNQLGFWRSNGYWAQKLGGRTFESYLAKMNEAGYPELQVGHPNGRKWSIRRMNQTSRWLRYLKEALRSPRWCKQTHRLIPWVQAECGPCNRKHGGGLRYKRNRGSPRGGRS